MEAENLVSPNTANEERKPATTAASPECNLSEDKCIPQLEKMEGDITVDQQKTDKKEEEERAEGDRQPDPAVISQEEGKHD